MLKPPCYYQNEMDTHTLLDSKRKKKHKTGMYDMYVSPSH